MFIPTALLITILIKDGSHAGTLVTRLPEGEGFRFDYLDSPPGIVSSHTTPRCVLVSFGGDFRTDRLSNIPCGIDEDRGYALMGLMPGDSTDFSGDIDVHWDSETGYSSDSPFRSPSDS